MPEFGDALNVYELEVDVTEEQLLRVHTGSHVARVADAFSRASWWPFPVNVDRDTLASKGTQAAATRAAGLVIAAVDAVAGDHSALDRAFVMARPPSHHAERDRAMGFCFYNSLMVGVAHAQTEYGMGRIAILDFDVHHGNGHADIARTDPSLLYVSSHQSPCFPGTGTVARRDGPLANLVNCPLLPRAGSAEFRGAWSRTLLPAVVDFDPDIIFVSAGFDGHGEDPLASMTLDDDDFEWITSEIARLGLPIVSVLEGGYNVEALKRAVYLHVDALIRTGSQAC
mmetsp:Transcript_31570/g.82524  ORF Transcript_31570/g.82524 Transcript_31570/m.82524 type:complete len:284 (+) Transcript_31570:152-1003(+)